MPDTHPTAGARLLDELSSEADTLVDAIADFGGDDLLTQATAFANRVAIAKAVLGPCLVDAPEPLKVRAIDWAWTRLDECQSDDIVWDDTTQNWVEVEWVNEDMGLDGRVHKVLLALGNGGAVAGKPSDVVRRHDAALALAVDRAIDDLHDREAEQFEREAI